MDPKPDKAQLGPHSSLVEPAFLGPKVWNFQGALNSALSPWPPFPVFHVLGVPLFILSPPSEAHCLCLHPGSLFSGSSSTSSQAPSFSPLPLWMPNSLSSDYISFLSGPSVAPQCPPSSNILV